MLTPAETLAAAADKLDTLIAGTSIAPWAEPYEGHTPDDAGWWVHNGGLGMKEHAVTATLPYNPHAEADARYIAAMNPLVGKALAEWLLDERVRAMNAGTDPNSNAVALARLILGGAS